MAKVVTHYPIPTKLRTEGSPASVGISLLSAEQEILASKLGGFNYMRSQYEATKSAICAFDKKPVTDENGDISKFWERTHPKVRALLLEAYNRMTSASDEESKDFFGGEETVIE